MAEIFPPQLDASIPSVLEDLLQGTDQWMKECEGSFERLTIGMIPMYPRPFRCIFVTNPPPVVPKKTTLFRSPQPAAPPPSLFKRPRDEGSKEKTTKRVRFDLD